MQEIIKSFRSGIENFGELKVQKVYDYSEGLDGLSKADVLKHILEGNSSVVVRPSSKESKLKEDISSAAKSILESGTIEL